jgi:hypothetical protein
MTDEELQALAEAIVAARKGQKSGSKPWHIEKRGDKYCVILDASGETVKCHPTRAEALAHMRALYANAKYSDEQERDDHGRWTSGGIPAVVADTVLGSNIATVSGVALAEKAQEPGGGFTMDLRTGEPVMRGFAVAMAGNERAVPADASLPDAIERYVDDHADILAEPGNMLGAWHDDIPDSATFGQVVLDISHVVASHDEAVEYGRSQQQTAIFDLTTFETEDIRAARREALLQKRIIEMWEEGGHGVTDEQGL